MGPFFVANLEGFFEPGLEKSPGLATPTLPITNYWQFICNCNPKHVMNVKRIFGILLTVLGIIGLIYFAVLFMDASGTERQVKTLIVYGLLGAIFFFTGIGLIRNTRDDARPPVR